MTGNSVPRRQRLSGIKAQCYNHEVRGSPPGLGGYESQSTDDFDGGFDIYSV